MQFIFIFSYGQLLMKIFKNQKIKDKSGRYESDVHLFGIWKFWRVNILLAILRKKRYEDFAKIPKSPIL